MDLGADLRLRDAGTVGLLPFRAILLLQGFQAAALPGPGLRHVHGDLPRRRHRHPRLRGSAGIRHGSRRFVVCGIKPRLRRWS